MDYVPYQKRYGKYSPIGMQTQDGETSLNDCMAMITIDDIAMLNKFFDNFVIKDVERFIYLDQYLDLPTVGSVLATEDDAYEALHRCIESDCVVPNRYNKKYLEKIAAINMAADKGHLEVLKWLKEQGVEMDIYVATYAAENGHLDVLKWFKKQGVEMVIYVACYAARYGHLDILKWLKEQGVVMDSSVAWQAADKGHLEVLKWLKSEGVEMDNEVAKNAAMNGHLDIVKWLKE